MISRLQASCLAFLLLLPNAAFAQDSSEATEIAEQPAPVIEPTIPAPIDADARRIVEGSNAFSLDLLRALGPADRNLIVSPASVSAAVGFAYRGAKGETAAQLQKALHYPFEPQRHLIASADVFDSMSFSATGRTLRTANAIWLQDGMPFEPDYERDLVEHAKSGLQRTDFKADPEAARTRINQWVSGATNGNIPALLQPGIITAETRAALVNAIWFKADWVNPFPEAATKAEPFTPLNGKAAPHPLMNQTDYFRALKREGVSAIQIPYVGGEVALIAFLPDDSGALPRFEQRLTSEKLASWFAALDRAAPRETILTLPKMKLRWHEDLKPTLEAMAGALALSDNADFDGMAKSPPPGGDPREVGLKIDRVIHEATVEVDEIGSEASAATAVTMIAVTGARRGPPPPPPFVFRADKPFLFALRDLRTGLLLFIGRYVAPQPDVAEASP